MKCENAISSGHYRWPSSSSPFLASRLRQRRREVGQPELTLATTVITPSRPQSQSQAPSRNTLAIASGATTRWKPRAASATGQGLALEATDCPLGSSTRIEGQTAYRPKVTQKAPRRYIRGRGVLRRQRGVQGRHACPRLSWSRAFFQLYVRLVAVDELDAGRLNGGCLDFELSLIKFAADTFARSIKDFLRRK
jgi:hypothetical protein